MNLAFKYSSKLADRTTIQILEKDGAQWIYGTFSGQIRDVFVQTETPRSSDLSESAYLAYANMSPDIGGIIDFASVWGIALRTSVSFTQPKPFEKEWTPSEEFCFPVSEWQEEQQALRSLIIASDGSLRTTPPPSDERKRFLSVRQVVLDSDAFSYMHLRLTSLWAALFIMALFQKDNIRKCANVRCNNIFASHKLKRLFCCKRCMQLGTKRKWWNETGSKNRQKARARGAQKKSPKV